jgi:demethylmenaquinone methyltransferase/2-methoxy-6-polyprenyl-1,4-benzoquinol methylase
MAELLSFGQNRRWRRYLVARVPASEHSRVLDVATGTAGVAIEMARLTGARIAGLDPSEPMLARGKAAVAEAGLDGRIALVLGQAELLPFPDEAFDAVTFTYLLRYVDDPAATLAELARVLKPRGLLASLEFFLPPNRLVRAAWYCYTRVGLPLAGLLASREWFRAGRFLGPSVSEFYRRYPLVEQGRIWRAAGIERVRYRTMSLGGGIVMWGPKRHA